MCMALTCIYMPRLEEAAPTWVYFANLFLLFSYQTLDAIDGKQARRTNTSTPLGQLFDHGCDAFSTQTAAGTAAALAAAAAAAAASVRLLQVFAALSVLGTIRVGQSVAAFMLIAILQMQLFIYTWWELHFHEYRCHTGITGVTEGQFVMMGMNIISLVFGPQIFTTSLADVAPVSFARAAPPCLLTLPLQAFLAFPFYLLLVGMLTSDVLNGCRLAARPAKAISVMWEHPVLCYWTMICNTAIIALRLNLSATCRMDFSPVQWPVLPFWFCCIWLYAVSPSASGVGALLLPQLLQQQQKQQLSPYSSAVLAAVLLWSFFYLVSLLRSTVSLICQHFNISCFGVGQVARAKEQ
ncbi:aminoalcoholphosphotransferase, putative [Eimeria necatrix]|uniref:Aminoalcoholphosphotransferase, putative n=1 Tax=Eimeria necatrix TaxID=51315 RepID=U6MYW6_9EIME|nr:aminoalcoholphosphotransferase, putative [Eimeria necatrix]CDJ69432.1 aminoalcoholphosphotransferase, putative [Eimeria necatrix]